MNRIVVTPMCPMRFFEVCSHTPCTELPPSAVGVAARAMKLPASIASLSVTVSVTEPGALADVCFGLADVIHLERLDRRRRPAMRTVGGEVGHQLDDLIGCRGRHEVEFELGAHRQNVSAVSVPRGKLAT